MPTEPKHTKGELSFEPAGRVFGSSLLRVDKPRKEGEANECIAETDGLNHEANAARLVAGWNHLNELDRLKTTPEKVLNLLNRLEEMGVDVEQVPEIVKALAEIRDLKVIAPEWGEPIDIAEKAFPKKG